MSAEELRIIDQFLQTEQMMVMSTVNDATNSPEAAMIAFAHDDDLNIYFQTSSASRKFGNLQNNHHVAIVIGLTHQNPVSIQLEGLAEELTGEAVQAAKDLLIAKDSPSQPRLNNPDTTLFRIKPSWLRYSDYREHPPKIFENNF